MPETVRNQREVARDTFRMQRRIAALLRDAPRTIPRLACDLGAPSHEVTYWLMAMWRYGRVEPTGKPDLDGYYQYVLRG
jgi:predicted transcriptional regulator